MADSQLHGVAHNDILIVGTDGVFDNLYDEQIIDLIQPYISKSDDIEDPESVADTIAQEAERLGGQEEYMSPFAKNALIYGYDLKGGK